MIQGSNVVKLETKRVSPANASVVKLPAPLLKLKDRCGVHLKKLMGRFFEKIDDVFFDMADHAKSNDERSRYFNAMREIRLNKPEIIRLFLESYKQGFEFSAGEKDAEKPLLFDSENLSVVQNDELEEQVATDNIISRIKNEVGQELDHLTLRFDALLPTVDLEESDNPLGAERLVDGFASACQRLELDIHSKLVLYKIFEKQVLTQVRVILAAANKYLMEQGVMTEVSVAQQEVSPSPALNQGQAAEEEDAGLLGDVDSGLYDNVPETMQVDPMALMAQVHSRMPKNGMGDRQAELPTVAQPNLVNALSTIQHRGKAVPVNDAGVVDFVNMLQRMMQGKDGNPRAQINQVDQDAINLVSMLFEYILEDGQLQAPVKSILGRLQIPLVKVALMDKTFFNKGGHIARRLLNELAMASIGWTEKAKGAPDPFLTKLETIVLRVVNEFEEDVSLFQEALDDFHLFQETEKRRRVLLEQRIRDAEEGRAKTDAAKRYVQNELNALLSGQRIPDFILNLLREGWSNYMVLLRLKYDENHHSLQEAKQLAATLIQSASLQSDAEILAEKDMDSMLSNLRTGLEQTAFMPYELDKVMADLQDQLTAIIQQRVQQQAQQLARQGSVVNDSEPVKGFSQENRESLVEESKLTTHQEAPGGTKESAVNEEAEQDFYGGLLIAEASVANGDDRQPEPPQDEARKSIAETDTNSSPATQPDSSSVTQPDSSSVTQPDSSSASELISSEAAATSEPAKNRTNRLDDLPEIKGVENPSIILLEEEPEEEPEIENEECLAQVERLGIGAWIELRESEHNFYRCKLAAIIKSTGKFIFVNRMGAKVAEKSKMGLLKEVVDKTVKILDDGLLFDRALESVITTLRK